MVAENYSECLHCPGVHPELNRLSHYLSGEGVEGEGAWCGGSMTLAEGAPTMGTTATAERPRLAGADRGKVLYFALFPNTLVSLHPDYVMLHTLWPQDVGRTEVVCDWLFEPGVTEVARRRRLLGPGQPRGLGGLPAHAARRGHAAASRPAATRRRSTTCTRSTRWSPSATPRRSRRNSQTSCRF